MRSGAAATTAPAWSKGTAAALGTGGQFLALRPELVEAWRPRDAQDWLLIDKLAQFQTAMERWQDTLANYTYLRGRKGPSRKEDERDLPACRSPGRWIRRRQLWSECTGSAC